MLGQYSIVSMSQYKRIILSGFVGAGKSTLAYRLRDVYQWPLYSIGDTWRAMWKEKYPDANPSFEKFIEGLTRKDDSEMNERMRASFEKEYMIGDARYSLCYKDIPALFVFITAPLVIRAQRALQTEKYKGKSVEEIKRILIEREEHEVEVCKDICGADYRDTSQYHLVLNSGLITLEEEVNIVATLVPRTEGSL